MLENLNFSTFSQVTNVSDADILDSAIHVLQQHGYGSETTSKLSRIAAMWRSWDTPHSTKSAA